MSLFFKKKTSGTIKADPSENIVSTESKKKTKSANTRIAKDVLETIPYRNVYPSLGIIEDLDGRYSKSYYLADANFSVENDDKKAEMYLSYEKVLNSITPGMIGQLTIFNRSVDMDTVRNDILMKPNNDGLNKYRDCWNDVYLSKLQEGRNNLQKEKLFTVSVESDNIFHANDALKNVDKDVNRYIRAINGQNTPPMTIEDRLGLLYDFFNLDNDLPWEKKIQPVVQNGKIDFKTLHDHIL